MTTEVGRSVLRLEGPAKATGTAEYIFNLDLPGMLHAKVLRSTVPHGRIVRIDTSAAAALPGVHRVITGQDVLEVMPDPYYGPAFHDQPVLAVDKVRFVGDPVAVVLAHDVHVADDALELIEVEYEELPAVYDEVEAAQPGAAIVHETLRPASMYTDLKHLAGRTGTNIGLDYRLRHGDVAQGFAAADRIFEHTFRTQQVAHTTLEPIVSVAEVTDTGRLVIHTASQGPSFPRAEVARLLGWPENRVRVRTAFLGGGFGAKLYVKLEALVAACALLTRRPVRLCLTMEEQFLQITKHASTFRIKTGVTNDGRIVARQCEVWWNGGAYADIGPRVAQKSGFTAAGPYDIEHVSIDSYSMYTNRPTAGPLRGFGIPQLVWAYESQADIIARELGIDPVEFRRRNILRNGRPHATGTVVQDAGFEEVLEATARSLGWRRPFDRGEGRYRRGRGLAIGVKAVVTPTTAGAIAILYGDGSCGVYCGTVDMGQGSDTATAQIAAEVLGLRTDHILMIHADTDVTPYDMSTLGSRSLFHMGNAVKMAAEQIRAQIFEVAGPALGAAGESLRLEDGAVIAPGGSRLTLAEVMQRRFGMQAGNLVGVGSYTPPYHKPDAATGQSDQITAYWMSSGAGAEVEVDIETGRVRVLRLVNVGDVGKAVNPDIARRQLYGAAIMQLGATLTEEMHLDNGQVVNASLADYKVPTIGDIPEHSETHLVEVPHRSGPFGVKGAGESGTFGVSPAIANAIFDAVGVRLTELPMTPERVLRALRAKDGHPLEKE
jgi:CO/xanthine dehydrogenase Mo-binding subunit